MFAAVCKFVTTEKCTIKQLELCRIYIQCHGIYLLFRSLSTSSTQYKGILSKNILLNKLFTDVAPYVSICVFCLVEELVTTEGIRI